MAMRTIECALSAPEEIRRKFWGWTEKYTLIVNELIEKVPQDSRFQEWNSKGQVPAAVIDKEWIAPLKKDSENADLPNLFYVSAKHMVFQVYKSWFAIQKQSCSRIARKKAWLNLVNIVLDANDSDPTHDTICTRAAHWISHIEAQAAQDSTATFSKFRAFMEAGKKEKDRLDQLAIAYLLLNNLKLPESPFDPDKLRQRLTRQEIEINRLQAKVDSQLPKGRDPLGKRYLEDLETAISLPSVQDPETLEAEFERWRHQVQVPAYNQMHFP